MIEPGSATVTIYMNESYFQIVTIEQIETGHRTVTEKTIEPGILIVTFISSELILRTVT
jgi:hypothetical protein